MENIADLLRVIDDLQRRLAMLEGEVSHSAHPLQRVFVANVTGAAAWNERASESGAWIDYADGRTGAAALMQLDASAGGCTMVLIEERDGDSHVYYPLLPLGSAEYVNLSSTGGTGGDQTHAPSFVYTVTNIRGDTIGTGMSPTQGRRNGLFTAATMGGGYWSSGTFVLVEAFETPTTVAQCAGGG